MTQAGETSGQAAQRELREELGLSLDLRLTRPHISVSFERGFDDIFLVEADLDIQSLTLQPEEVKQAKWAAREEIRVMIDSGEFIPYYKSLIDLLFDKFIYPIFNQ